MQPQLLAGVLALLGVRHAATTFGILLASAALGFLLRRASAGWPGDEPLPPVRVTPETLEVPGPAGPVRVAWADVVSAELRGGRLSPRLVVVPSGPQRLDPAPNPWDRAAARRIVTLLDDLSAADRRRLRAELAAHLRRRAG